MRGGNLLQRGIILQAQCSIGVPLVQDGIDLLLDELLMD
jgi:hypothetical protein